MSVVEDTAYALSLYFVFYDFTRTHKAHRVSLVMAGGVADRLWDVNDIVALIDARTPKPRKRGPYKRQAKLPSA